MATEESVMASHRMAREGKVGENKSELAQDGTGAKGSATQFCAG